MFDTVIGEYAANRIFNAVFVQPVPNLFHRKAIPVLPERFQHERGGKRVNVEFPLRIQRIAERSTTTIAATFQDVLCLSTDNLFGKVGRVVFCIALQHRFQNDALRSFGDDLGGRHKLDTVLLELGLIPGTVVAVPGKTVQLPDQHNVKQLLVAVLNHLLEFRAVVRFGGDSTVNIVLDDGDAVFSRHKPCIPGSGLRWILRAGCPRNSEHRSRRSWRAPPFYTSLNGNTFIKAMFRIMYIPQFCPDCKPNDLFS